MSEVHTSDISFDSMIKEDVPPREKRRNAREELAYIEPLEEPGTIYNAEVHGVAQCLLKVHRVAKYVKFCRCCSLAKETPSVVVPFIWFDAQLDFCIVTDEQKDNIDKIFLDYSLIHFLTVICVLITNYLFIQIVSLLFQYENFKSITPSEHTALIHGVPKRENNTKMKDEIPKIFENVSHYTTPLVVDQVIPCLRIEKLMKLLKKST